VVDARGRRLYAAGMGSPLPSTPVEQAKVLRRLADDIERAHTALPADVFAPIVDLVEHRDRKVQLDAVEQACGAWRGEDHPELSQGAAAYTEACRNEDDARRGEPAR
jgi:broad specificity phosphatase PhoE